jgi:hypothetical protein
MTDAHRSGRGVVDVMAHSGWNASRSIIVPARFSPLRSGQLLLAMLPPRHTFAAHQGVEWLFFDRMGGP